LGEPVYIKESLLLRTAYYVLLQLATGKRKKADPWPLVKKRNLAGGG
jgi:hypothetical protein